MTIVSPTVDCDKSASPLKIAAQLQAYVQQAAEEGRPLHEVERNIFDTVLKMGYAATELFLQGQGDGDLGATVSTEDGQTLYRSEQPAQRPLRTIFGQHTIVAYVYAPGSHEKIALRPIDARLELPPGRTSYLFEEFSQHFCVDQSFGQASVSFDSIFGQKISVDTLERINVRMGAQAEDYLGQLPTPDAQQEGALLVFTADAKGVPMIQEDTAQRAAFEEPPLRPGNRRMATLASVYSVDRYVRTPEQIVESLFRDGPRIASSDRPKPQFKHVYGSFAKIYGALADDAVEVPATFEAFSWAQYQLETRLQEHQPLVRLMDGQASLWSAADVCLESSPAGLTVDVLDILHVSTYVWDAAKVFHSTFEHQEAFARERLLRILQGGVRSVIAGLRQMATKRKLSSKARKQIHRVCGYFEKHAERMRYDEYLRKGYPIASGVIEGACRHFVKDRMERTGMRWRIEGAQAMLNVRALFLSSYWDHFHSDRIENEQRQLHPHNNLIDDYQPRLAA